MNAKQRELAERRHVLIAQAATQRTALRRELQLWQPPLALADQGLGALRYARKHWLLVAAGVVVLGVTRPARLGTWLYRGWIATRLVYRLGLGPANR